MSITIIPPLEHHVNRVSNLQKKLIRINNIKNVSIFIFHTLLEASRKLLKFNNLIRIVWQRYETSKVLNRSIKNSIAAKRTTTLET